MIRRVSPLPLPVGKELQLDLDGVCRVKVFPGLWVHGEALFAKDYARLMATLQEGLATPEHAAFVTRLAAGRPPRKRANGGGKRPRK